MSPQHARVRSSKIQRKWRSALVAIAFGTSIALVASALPGEWGGVSPATAVEQQAPVTDRPDRVSASIAAKAQGSRVEVLGERTESQLLYANPDDTFTLEAAPGPVRVQRDDGSWSDIDTTLQLSPDGAHVEPVAAAADISLSNGATDPIGSASPIVATVTAPGDPASLAAGEASLISATAASDAPVDDTVSTGGVSVSVGWLGDLPKPTLAGNEATYADVAPGQDLRVEAKSRGFETYIDVKERPATVLAGGVAVSLPLSMKGLTAAADGAGGLLIKDKAGKVVSDTPPARVWDATTDPRSGDPIHEVTVPTKLVSTPAGLQVTVIVPDSFLSDPAVVFPITIDPVSNIYANADTFVEKGYNTTNFGTDDDLRVGTYDGGTHIARSFLAFPSTAYAGAKVTSAFLHLYEWHSASCSARAMDVKRISAAWWESGATWNTQPTFDSTVYGTINTALGYSSSCPAGQVNGTTGINVTSLADAWAAGTFPNNGLALTASETDSLGWKRFYSSEHTYSSPKPWIGVTFSHYPDSPGTPVLAPAAGTGPSAFWTNTTTPKLSATVHNADGASVQGRFELYIGNTKIWTGLGNTVGGSGTSSVTVPASAGITTGTLYTVRVWGVTGTLVSKAWSNYIQFNYDATAPGIPTVSSSQYPANAWQSTAVSGSFTFTPPGTNGSDINQYRYWINNDAPSTVVAPSLGASATVTFTPPNGWDTLTVQSVDRAGNTSASTTYSFGVVAGLSQPLDGSRTLAAVALAGTAPATATQVTFQYQTPADAAAGTWTTVPAANVTIGSTPISGWPQATTVASGRASTPVGLTWNVSGTLAGDGPVTVRAMFGGAGAIYSNSATATLDQKAFGQSYATESVGPGSVSLQTGNFAMSATDVSVPAWGSELSLSRTFNSQDPSLSLTVGQQILGPGWRASLPSGDGSDWSELRDVGTGVLLVDTDGGYTSFLKSGTAYLPVGDAAGLALVKNSSTDVFTVTDSSDGSSVNFGLVSTPSQPSPGSPSTPRKYKVTSVVAAGTGATTVPTYDGAGRVTDLLAPQPSGVTCTQSGSSWPAGCQKLKFYYATFGGQLRLSTVTAYSGSATGTLIASDMACFDYTTDSNARLISTWDPRTVTPTTVPTCADSATKAVLKTQYSYTANGEIASVTNPGTSPTTLTYGDIDGTGPSSLIGLTSATQGGLTTNVLYGTTAVKIATPATGSEEANPDLSPTTAALWGQTDLPYTAAGVFGPGDNTSDLRDGTIHAIDANGREVNTAVFSGTGQAGWKVSTTQYDQFGNTVRSLSASNRDRVLAPDISAELAQVGLPTTYSSKDLAEALADISIYSTDGTDLLDTYGPTHVGGAGGNVQPIRAHTRNTYGTLSGPGADPTQNGPIHSVVSSYTAASSGPGALAQPSVPVEFDTRSSTSQYALSASDATGWTHRTPQRTTTTDGAGQSIVTETRLDAATGNVIESRLPKSAGSSTTPGSTLTTYYFAGTENLTNCVSSRFLNLVCKVAPGGQVAGSPDLPTKWFTYDWLGRPTVVTEKNNAGTVLRTTTTVYETTSTGFGPRPISVTITGATGTGTALGATTTTYDPNTGATASVSQGGATVSTTYDSLGRVSTFTDADGSLTTTSYDATRGRVTGTAITLSGNTVTSTTLGYDGGTEHRGLVTSTTSTGAGGSFAGVYDADGALASESWPNGVSRTWTRDEVGDTRDLVVSKSGLEWLHDSQLSNVFGQWLTSSSAQTAERGYSYDGVGRLTKVTDDAVSGSCLTRSYVFDANSNRTSSSAFPADATDASVCQSSTGAVATASTFDAADRQTASGLTYDVLGRTTAVPGSLIGDGAALSVDFYVNDMVHGQSNSVGTRSWSLDPGGRLRAATFTPTAGTAAVSTNHYSSGGGDSPSWIAEAGGSATRFVSGLGGDLALSVTGTIGGTLTQSWQVTNLHGDVVATATGAVATPDSAYTLADEYGRTSSTSRYGWLGGKQRSTDSLGSLTLMGVRLYNPVTGRFLSVDPVPGGNPNAYTYPVDPINSYDLDGRIAFAIPVAWWVVAAVAGAFAGSYAISRQHYYWNIDDFLYGSTLQSPWALARPNRYYDREESRGFARALEHYLFAKKRKASAKNSNRKNHRSNGRKSTYDKDTKAQGYGGAQRIPPNPNTKNRRDRRGQSE